MSEPTIRTAPLPGGHLAYVEQGSGRPVVLLHGGALDHRMWAPQLDHLGDRHRVVAVDARGHGRSSTPTAPFRHADDLAALLEQLGIAHATLVGLSMGGGTAVDTAVEYPGLVDALVISGVGTSDPDFRDPWVLEIFRTWQRTQEAGDAAGWLDAFMLFAPGPHRTLSDVDPGVTSALRGMAEDTLAAHIREGHVVLPSPVPGVRSRALGITAPTLALVGGLDADDHIRMARELADALPHGRTRTIDGTAHYPNLEKPGDFNKALDAFLDET